VTPGAKRHQGDPHFLLLNLDPAFRPDSTLLTESHGPSGSDCLLCCVRILAEPSLRTDSTLIVPVMQTLQLVTNPHLRQVTDFAFIDLLQLLLADGDLELIEAIFPFVWDFYIDLPREGLAYRAVPRLLRFFVTLFDWTELSLLRQFCTLITILSALPDKFTQRECSAIVRICQTGLFQLEEAALNLLAADRAVGGPTRNERSCR
jgi:hypothetical protein